MTTLRRNCFNPSFSNHEHGSTPGRDITFGLQKPGQGRAVAQFLTGCQLEMHVELTWAESIV